MHIIPYQKGLTTRIFVSRIVAVASSRIVLILPDDLLKSLNGLAKRKGLSRASYIRMALTEQVEAESEPGLAQALRSPRALAQYIRTSAGEASAARASEPRAHEPPAGR
jgi:hypothetical protein